MWHKDYTIGTLETKMVIKIRTKFSYKISYSLKLQLYSIK